MPHNYNTLVKVFESYLKDQIITDQPNSLYDPIKYINVIGGKRIRPVLLLMTYNMWFDDVAPALRPALAIEYFHNFTLMHDDIMDEATLRRGHESVHTRFGKNAAILSGDAMLIKCFEYLIDYEINHRLPSSITQVMTKVAVEICEGQQLDMDFEKRDDVSVDDYIEMIRKKTACLLGACFRIGSMLANGTKEIAQIMYACGENLGIAFQIQDDILDVLGDSELTGKQKGGDILRGKKNFLYVQAYNALTGRERENFIHAYNTAASSNDILPVITIYESLNIAEQAQVKQMHYFNQGMRCLDDLTSVDTSLLKRFASELLSRNH